LWIGIGPNWMQPKPMSPCFKAWQGQRKRDEQPLFFTFGTRGRCKTNPFVA
jgi:hypothetical protein